MEEDTKKQVPSRDCPYYASGVCKVSHQLCDYGTRASLCDGPEAMKRL